MRPLVLVLFAALGLSACKTQHIFVPVDAGPECEDNLELVNGTCMFVCHRDGDCMAGERCNLFTGQCETKPPPADAGPTPDMCTTGATRCTSDKKGIESCQADATWMTTTSCPQGGFCQDDKCLACQPGAATCDPMDMTKLNVCKDDGSGINVITCTMPATCQSNECRACAPNTYRCSPDGKSLQQCSKGSDPTATWSWTNIGDNFDGTCITGQCIVGGPDGYQCVAPQCFPGQIQCKDVSTAQTCGTMGSWVDMPCTVPAQCTAGVCVDECANAAAAKSYFGCDYWAANLDNSMDALFKGGTMSGQGTTDSDFVFVATNQSANQATVNVYRWLGASMQMVKSVMVPGRNDAATHGLVKIPVPWQSITPASEQAGQGITGKQRYGYHVTSTKPITLYQFNPIDAIKYTKTCTDPAGTPSCTCNELSNFDIQGLGPTLCSFFGADQYNAGICANAPGGGKKCSYGTFSNDASLLLPTHDLDTAYVVITPDSSHIHDPPDGIENPRTGQMVIVGTQDTTTVTVKSTAVTAAGTGVAALAKGSSTMFTLNSFDVLQLTVDTTSGTDAECTNYGMGITWCRKNNNLTGTVVTSDKPVAVFAGHPCLNQPYSRPFCDHVEEEIFPFSTWGKKFVALPSHPLRLENGSFSTSPPPDDFKIVAACPVSQCPNGTTITLSTPPTAANVLAPNNCQGGTSLVNNNCRLLGGGFVEFQSVVPFTVTADQPIAVAQFYPGQGPVATPPNPTDPSQGDPSMVLLPPAEQWRAQYTVLASTGLVDNYLGLAIDTTTVQSVSVDGTQVTGFAAVSGTTYQVKNHPVTNGTHTITVIPKAGAMGLIGAGVTIYGYDAQVSYGYTGGLDLQAIVTGINPGG